MILIDRLAIVWALAVFGFMAWVLSYTADATNGLAYLKGIAIFAGAPWLLLRGLWWVFRRRDSFTYRVLR